MKKFTRTLKFAKKQVNRSLEFLKIVIFRDGSKFNIFGYDGHKTMWWKDTALENKNAEIL